jgi:hypothetical protein
MSLIRTSFAWRFVTQISEIATPLEFLQFQEAITIAAARQGLRYSVAQRMSEQKIRGLMVEAIGRSLMRSPTTLPSVASEVSIEGERWHVILNATSIPHFRASVVQSEPRPGPESNYRVSLVRHLVEQDRIDYCIVENDRLHGKTWRLYLHCKIRLLKRLRELFSKSPFRKVSVLLPPDTVFPQLAASLPQKTTLKDDPTAVREFLDECDQILTTQIGERGLNQYLQSCSISLASFLHAQHSTASKIRALF